MLSDADSVEIFLKVKEIHEHIIVADLGFQYVLPTRLSQEANSSRVCRSDEILARAGVAVTEFDEKYHVTNVQ